MKTLTKKTTHIARIRQENKEGQHEVCYFLQCTEQEYCNYHFDQYCLFIQERYKGFPDIIAKSILYSSVFRGLYNNAAARRDEEEFLPFAKEVTQDAMMITEQGKLLILTAVPLGSEYIVDEWMHAHSYKSLLQDDQFINQFNHVVQLLKII